MTYSHCNDSKCNSISIQGDNIIVPVLFGVAVGLLIAKSLN
ncbi:hypothetical protein [Tenacibaculum finnmarkense]|nr:hypothetical protein [Tenacibaculum finnmarkense]MDB0616268.1 hypothetical protein [Tenacibaculum dicentrarchi]WCC44173.1 hypothetical protein PJW08_10310 [Tenacibaculum finnmarkense]